MTITSRWIDIPADRSGFQGYLALPPTGKGPGIVLLQEIFGVNSHIQSVADQYAADGYVVLAPDVFWRAEPRVELGYEGADREKAVELMQKTDVPQTVRDITSAVAALRAQPALAGKITAIGYCFGGRLAYLAAAESGVDAAVCYYGGGIQTQLDVASRIKVPMQFHYGERDTHIPMDAVEAVKASFKGRDATFFVYPGAEHGFNCAVRASYQQHAAALSHGRTLTFLGERF